MELPIRVKTRRMLPDIVDQYGPQNSNFPANNSNSNGTNGWSLKVQPNQNNGKTYISVFESMKKKFQIIFLCIALLKIKKIYICSLSVPYDLF